MQKNNIESIQQLISDIQDDPEIFSLNYCGFPLWSIVKNRLFNSLLNALIEKKVETIYEKIFSTYRAFIEQLCRLPIAYVQWFLIKISLNDRKKPTMVLLIDGFFRNKNENGSYEYPFGEEIQLSNKSKFDTISIERNHRRPKRGKPFISPNICEDIVSFTIPLRHYFLKNRELVKKKNKLLLILYKKLIDRPDIFNILKKELFSPMTDHLLYGFTIKKKKAKNILSCIKPFSLLLTAPVGLLWWVAAAKELNIRVIELQHGLIDKNQPQYNWSAFLKEGKSKLLTPDVILMWGNYWVDENLLLGFWRKDELISCGFTKLDKVREKYSNLIQSSLKDIHVDSIKYVYTSSKPIRNEAIAFLDEFINLIKKNNLSVKVIIKLHPFEDKEFSYYYKLKEKYFSFCEIYYHSDINIYDLFVESTVHLSVFSAAILESIELGRPTLILNLPGKEYFNNLIEKSVVRFAESPLDLLKINEQIKNNSSFWQQWIEDTTAYKEYYFSKDSTDSSVSYLNSLIVSN